MKVLFAALCVVVFAGVVAARTPEENVALEAEFSAWTVEYGKTYATDAEYKLRKEIFADNKLRIAKQNAVDPAAVYGINEFADLDPQEFADIVRIEWERVWGGGVGVGVGVGREWEGGREREVEKKFARPVFVPFVEVLCCMLLCMCCVCVWRVVCCMFD